MTIENSVKYLTAMRKTYQADTEMLSIAIDTMRKYQKITEIVKSWRENGLDYDSCDAMENIERVIEDGKID